MSPPLDILRSRFGFSEFRPLQAEVIDNVLSGNDSLVLMPTGGGKSICYQLPALMFGGITLVVSPLIALMKDQVDALNANGIPAAFFNSSLSGAETWDVQQRVRQGQVKLLYVAPERLAMPDFRRFLHGITLSLIAIDEAHCISEWGHDFRPDYRDLKQLRKEFSDVPAIALTATATPRVRDDIIEQLGLGDGQAFVSSFNRENLTYSVRPKNEPLDEVVGLLRQNEGEAAIIYCLSRTETGDLAADLVRNGFNAKPYHAGLDPATRQRTQDDFRHDRVPIIVATIAFGMGIDKPDVRLVIHYSLPKSVEGYYQESGRAGRDGQPSECVLFYSPGDKSKHDYFINQTSDPQQKMNERFKLGKMTEYAELPSCRRRFLLEYFGESYEADNCGACDVCVDVREEFDATEITQKILSAVIRTGERFGAGHVIDVLTGSRRKRVLDLKHDELSVHGIANDFGRMQLTEIVRHLEVRGLLERDTEYATLAVSQEGREFLTNRETLAIPRPASEPISHRRKSRADAGEVDYDEGLFEELRTLRRRLAEMENVPPYFVFGDAALHHMAVLYPVTAESFLQVPGVGVHKLEKYGQEFMDLVRRFVASHNITRPASAPVVPRSSRVGKRARRIRRITPTLLETKSLVDLGVPLSDIAQHRGLVEGTIVAHLEQLVAAGETVDISHLLPEPDAVREIEETFTVYGGKQLRLVLEYLEEQYSYNEIRLARLNMQQEGRFPD